MEGFGVVFKRLRLIAILGTVSVLAAACGGDGAPVGSGKSTSKTPSDKVEQISEGEATELVVDPVTGETVRRPVTRGTKTGGGNQPSGPVATNPPGVPSFGLRTQGVSANEVKVGYTYNVAQCGDAGTLQAMLGNTVTGDPGKAITAFTRHVNDTGGIGGKTLKIDVIDDGGAGCPEKNTAAAVKALEELKDFAVIPGLHVVSDYLMERKLPVFGGRDDPESLKRFSPNGLGLLEPLEPTFRAWSAFGKYYLDSGSKSPCLIHIESGAAGDYDNYAKLLVKIFESFGLKFVDVIQFKDDVSTAQQQANTIAQRAKSKGCDQAYFLAGNAIGLIFFTQAATNNQWFPTWTFTSYTVESDSDQIGNLMDQRQWANAVGLSSRVKQGDHPMEGNCRRIYEKYYPNDGQSDTVSVRIICAQILTASETMRRAIAKTGVLTAETLLVGADSIKNDFFYDAHIPIEYSIPGTAGPFKTKGFSHYTVVKWNASSKRYDFPTYPTYWREMGPNRSNGEDLRAFYKK